jgi:hypothetical protein
LGQGADGGVEPRERVGCRLTLGAVLQVGEEVGLLGEGGLENICREK